jgi:glucokinase
MSEFVVAVDLGGTLTKLALADADGTVRGQTRVPTYHDGGPAEIVTWLAGQVTAFAATAGAGGTCVGFGVVVPGIIDSATGTVRAAANIGWYDVPLRQLLSELTGLPGAVAHDVRCGGLAEWRLGSGVGAHNLLFLPLGTGIAGAMIVDGQMLDADGYAGELGHIQVPAAGDAKCPCGGVGCLETVASAAGVARSYHRITGAAPSVEAREIADRARAGEVAARQAFAIASEALVEALTIYVTLLAPEVIVIGGGLSGAADIIFPQLTAGLADRLHFQRTPRIEVASLGADAGVIGAGLIGWDRVHSAAGGSHE